MALTVVSIPDNDIKIGSDPWVAVFNESALSGKNNYRIEIELKDASTGSTLFGTRRFSFRPKSNGDIYCDLTAPLRTLLDFSDLNRDNLFGDDYRYNRSSTDRLGTLTKMHTSILVWYQAIWDGGSTVATSTGANTDRTVVNGTTNIITASYPRGFTHASTWVGGNAIGHIPDKIKFWDGFTKRVDSIFLLDGTAASGVYPIIEMNVKGRPVITRKLMLQNLVASYLGEYLDGFSFMNLPVGEYEWRILPNGSTGSVIRILEEGPTGVIYPIYYGNPKTFSFSARRQTSVWNPGTLVHLRQFRKIGNPTNTINWKLVNTVGNLPDETSVISSGTIDPNDHIDGYDLACDWSALNGGMTVVYAFIFEPNNDGVSDANNYWGITEMNRNAQTFTRLMSRVAGVWAQEGTKSVCYWDLEDGSGILPKVELPPIEVTEGCDNPVYLVWNNSYGCRSQWLFDYNQAVELEVRNEKRKVVRLFANNLTYEEFIMLDELNHINERTGDVSFIGNKVLDLAAPEGYQEVYVNPVRQRYQSNQQKWTIELEIEYKEIKPNLIG